MVTGSLPPLSPGMPQWAHIHDDSVYVPDMWRGTVMDFFTWLATAGESGHEAARQLPPSVAHLGDEQLVAEQSGPVQQGTVLMQERAIVFFIFAYLACWVVDLVILVARGPLLVDPVLKLIIVLFSLVIVVIGMTRQGWWTNA